MILDRRDLDLLRLAASCQWLPYENLQAFPLLTSLKREVSLLANLNLLTISRSHQYFALSDIGYQLLTHLGYSHTAIAKRPYAGSATLRRRLETGSIMLTCLGAGIDTTADYVDALHGQPVFLPALVLRTGDGNLMNAASCAGFGHWGNTAFMVQYASKDSTGLYLTNELRHLHNLSSVFGEGLDTPTAMILAGESYATIYGMLTEKQPSPRHGKHGFVDFWSAYERLDIPVHLLACNDTGIMQLAVMRQPEHRAKLARAAFGERWTPTDDAIPEADGHVAGSPLVIAVDMDLRRVLRVCDAAGQQHRPEVMVAALAGQMSDLLLAVLPREGVRPLRIGVQVLESAFGKDFSFASLPPGPAQAADGGLLYV